MSASTSASSNPSLPGRSSPGGAPSAIRGGALSGADPQQALAAYLSGLLERLCELGQAQAGVAFIRPGQQREGGLAAVHARPGSERLAQQLRTDAKVLARLANLAERAAQQAEGGSPQPVVENLVLDGGALYQTHATHRATAVPLLALGQAEGACVVLSPVGQSGPAAERSMVVAAEGFEGFLWSQRAIAESERTARLRETLEMLDAAQRGSSAQTMASLFCDELRRRFACSRVTVGLVQGQDIRAVAISGADTIDRRNPAVESLQAAMEECADQDIEVLYPQPEDLAPAERRVVRAHGELSRSFGPSSILSLPLRVDGDLVGVAVLERDADDPFPPGSLGLLRLVAEFIGPAVWTRRLADRGILAVTRDRVRDLGSAIVGPRHTLLKLVALLAILVFVALAVTPIPAVVSADAEAKALGQRAISPPFRGYLASVDVKPGDQVAAGQIIARMDTTEREAELAQLDAQYAAQRTQRETELSRGRMDQADVLTQQMAEIEARRELLRYQIDRAAMRAPIDGRVSGSDLEPWLDAAISPDTPILRIVGSESVVVLRVPERDIAAAQQRLQDEDDQAPDGTFAPRARPEERLPLRLQRVNPQAEAVAGGNVYLVEAEIMGPSPAWLRPGMTGRARVQSGWTTPLARLARPLIDRAQMAWWW